MLSYQHSYHAGSAADVYKHATLAIILNTLVSKNKPLTYFETHAGRGLYDLSCREAKKIQDEKYSITQLWAAHKIPEHHPYYYAIHTTKSVYGAPYYPGSPEIARLLLKPYDRMHLMELHPQEYAALKSHMPRRTENRQKKGPRVHIHKRNGYEGVMALSPPPIRHGMVFIDPSYEVKSEYSQVATWIPQLHHHWAQAVILLWYPLLKEKYHLPLTRSLQKAHLPKWWQQEIIFPCRDWDGLLGCGLICVNLPFYARAPLQTLCSGVFPVEFIKNH